MNRQYGSTSWRKKIEQALAGLAFTAMVAMVLGGTIDMCLRSSTLV
jgi:hypothetical protein